MRLGKKETKRKERRALDAYDTPYPLALAICQKIRQTLPIQPKKILDPCCGSGVFVMSARATWPDARIIAVDIDPKCERSEWIKGVADKFFANDFTQIDRLAFRDAGLILGNPPYSLAEEFVAHAWNGVKNDVDVFYLLRLGFAAGVERWTGEHADGSLGHPKEGLHNARPIASIWPVAPRPSFTGDGDTDRYDYGVFRWGHRRGYEGRTVDAVTWRRDGEPGRKP